MENMLKKALYTGVGLVTVASDKVQETVKNLVDNGKLSEEEGKKVVNDFMTDLDSKKNEFESRINNIVNKIVNTVDLPSRSDFSTLKNRIKELEAQLETSETTTSVKKVVKKAVAKKTTPAKKSAVKVKEAVAEKLAVAEEVVTEKLAVAEEVVAEKIAPVRKVMKKVTKK